MRSKKKFCSGIKGNLRPHVRSGLSLRGITLIELLMALIVATLIIWSVLTVSRATDSSFQTGMGLIDLHQPLRAAMDGMIREIREGKNVNIISEGEIEFLIPTSNNTISYYLDGDHILREHPTGIKRILADNINSLSFALTDDVVKIQIEATKAVRERVLSFSLTEKVRLRNE